ncbi:Flp pilus assembly protein CpaB [Kiritimatiellaeota bacterium B1221]|nr:Flp pilus assembly protein CpaB [Kiritimatiellaeota bacterium B1221]
MKQKIVLIIAVGMGVLAFVLTKMYLTAERNKLYEKAKMVSVLVAREDLPRGTILTSQNLHSKQEYESSVNNTAFSAENLQHLIGKTLNIPLRKGTAVSWYHVGANLDELTGLAPTIRSGMRAISIPVSGETAVSGLVRPNDKVDILGTFSFTDERNPGEMKTVTFTVLQDVTVLATGQETARAELEISSNSRKRTGYNTVTISVFPEEAELLAFAMNVKGSLMLSLRNPDDVSVMEQTPPIDFQTLQEELPRLNEKRQTILRGQGKSDILQR